VTDLVQIVSTAVSVALLALVVELVRRRKLTEEYSFIWIAGALGLLALSIWRGIIDTVASWLGIFYPPAILLMVLILFAFVVSLYFSVVISRQREQIERLVQDVAILDAEQRRLARAVEGGARRSGNPVEPPQAGGAASGP
jgi:hypothetical protein